MCTSVRAVTPHDAQHGVPSNAVILQMSAVPEEPAAAAAGPAAGPTATGPASHGQGRHEETAGAESQSQQEEQQQQQPQQQQQRGSGTAASDFGLVVVRGGASGEVSYVFEAMTALFGPELYDMTSRCLAHLLAAPAEALSGGCDGHLVCPLELPHGGYGRGGVYGSGSGGSCPAHLHRAVMQRRRQRQRRGRVTRGSAEEQPPECGVIGVVPERIEELAAARASLGSSEDVRRTSSSGNSSISGNSDGIPGVGNVA
ncbi:hypothetical protein Agub_g14978, partial [Astrephomene gubernaculifera]